MSADKKRENPVFIGFYGKYGVSLFLRRMGLEPTRDCSHKILSLARLPVPTPPRNIDILSNRMEIVK